MKVSIKDLSADIDLKNKGMELDIYDNAGTHLGDLVVTKTGITWCKGKTKPANGVKLPWAQAIKLFEEQNAKPAKKAAAKNAPAKKAPAKKAAAKAAASSGSEPKAE